MEERILESYSLLEKSDFQRSQNIVDTLKKENPSNPNLQLLQAEIWKKRASFHYNRKEYDIAKNYYNLLLSIWPNHPEILEKIKFANREIEKNKIPEKKEIEESFIQQDQIIFGDKEIQIHFGKSTKEFSYEKLFYYLSSPKKESSLDILFCDRVLLYSALVYIFLLNVLVITNLFFKK
jgi:tetratricopeptide (TPR) repeat protein